MIGASIRLLLAASGLKSSESGGWSADISTATYDNVSFSVADQDSSPYGIVFSPEGLRMFILGRATDSIYQYDLTTAFDITSASYSGISLNVKAVDDRGESLHFSPDGTMLFFLGSEDDRVERYNLSTGFDLSTATLSGSFKSVAAQETVPTSLKLNPDGTKMYIVGINNDRVYQYTLSTAYNLPTATYDNISFSVAGQDGFPYDLIFNPAGTKMYVLGQANDKIYQYSLSTAFDLSTASYDNIDFIVESQEATPYSLAFSADGSKMYVGGSGSTIYQYSI